MIAFASSHFDPNDYANAVLAGDPYIPSSHKPHIKPSVQDPPPKEDISVAISKLTIAIDDVSKQIKTVVRKICFITYLPSYLSFYRSQLIMSIYFLKPLALTTCLVHSYLFGEVSMTSSRRLKSTIRFYAIFTISYILECNRLRLKIRVPFQSLQAHVSCQQKLQLAADALRRTSRFVVLARRLQLQMADMNGTNVTESDRGNVISTSRSDEHGQDIEDEKERTIAKAALSIAELGEF
jgi:hypothetical protein